MCRNLFLVIYLFLFLNINENYLYEKINKYIMGIHGYLYPYGSNPYSAYKDECEYEYQG